MFGHVGIPTHKSRHLFCVFSIRPLRGGSSIGPSVSVAFTGTVEFGNASICIHTKKTDDANCVLLVHKAVIPLIIGGPITVLDSYMNHIINLQIGFVPNASWCAVLQ